jgi:hypothetical protein
MHQFQLVSTTILEEVQDKKRITLKSILSDVKLIISCTGISKAIKAMQRESTITESTA